MLCSRQGFAHVREQTTLRLRLEDAEAMKTKHEKAQQQLVALQLKLKTKELEIKKADGTLSKQEVKKEQQAIDKTKSSEKQKKQLADFVNLRRLNTLAAHIAKRIKKHWSGKRKEWTDLATVAAHLGPSPTAAVLANKEKLAPEFFKADVSRLRNVAHKGWGVKRPPPEWCSREFSVVVFGGSIAEAKNPNLKFNLRNLIKDLLPGYGKFLGAGFNVDTLMVNNNSIADLCFLEALWRYTNCVGLLAFPCGLDKWPPEEEDETSAKEASCAATGGAAASSSSCCEGGASGSG